MNWIHRRHRCGFHWKLMYCSRECEHDMIFERKFRQKIQIITALPKRVISSREFCQVERWGEQVNRTNERTEKNRREWIINADNVCNVNIYQICYYLYSWNVFWLFAVLPVSFILLLPLFSSLISYFCLLFLISLYVMIIMCYLRSFRSFFADLHLTRFKRFTHSTLHTYWHRQRTEIVFDLSNIEFHTEIEMEKNITCITRTKTVTTPHHDKDKQSINIWIIMYIGL